MIDPGAAILADWDRIAEDWETVMRSALKAQDKFVTKLPGNVGNAHNQISPPKEKEHDQISECH